MKPKQLKSIENKFFIINLNEDEDHRYVVKYKRTTMKDYVEYSFTDLKTANKVFDTELIALEGH